MDFASFTEDICGIDGSPQGISLNNIRDILQADVLCGEDKLENMVCTVCGCDLMSDVLAFTSPGSLLLTGLTNSQVVRTAEILDLKCVVFVRDKKPDETTIDMARENGIPLLSSHYPLFESCGLLFAEGLRGCKNSG